MKKGVLNSLKTDTNDSGLPRKKQLLNNSPLLLYLSFKKSKLLKDHVRTHVVRSYRNIIAGKSMIYRNDFNYIKSHRTSITLFFYYSLTIKDKL